MKKLFIVFFLLISSFSFSQTTNENEISNTNIYGVWVSMEFREVLIMDPAGYFIRINQEETIRGLFEIRENQVHVTKTSSEYDLIFSITGSTLVIEKPENPELWIFNKVSY